MCSHRTADRWFRFWSRFTAAFLSVFAVAETVGMIKFGPEAAYTNFWRRLLGQLEPCRHSLPGRALIIAFAAWLVAHLGWGRLGVGPKPRR